MRTWRHSYLDHTFIPYCTIFPQLSAHCGAVMHRWIWLQLRMHFYATLLILVLEIRFNFQIDLQCAEKAISKIKFHIRWNLEQIWHSWPTWVTSKGSWTMGSQWPGKHDKTGGGMFFSHGHPPQLKRGELSNGTVLLSWCGDESLITNNYGSIDSRYIKVEYNTVLNTIRREES